MHHTLNVLDTQVVLLFKAPPRIQGATNLYLYRSRICLLPLPGLTLFMVNGYSKGRGVFPSALPLKTATVAKRVDYVFRAVVIGCRDKLDKFHSQKVFGGFGGPTNVTSIGTSHIFTFPFKCCHGTGLKHLKHRSERWHFWKNSPQLLKLFLLSREVQRYKMGPSILPFLVVTPINGQKYMGFSWGYIHTSIYFPFIERIFQART